MLASRRQKDTVVSGTVLTVDADEKLSTPTFQGAETVLRAFDGVRAARVSHSGGHIIAEHRHDWPTLTVHVAGACTERLDHGEVRIAGPSASLLPAGHFHADVIEPVGLETFGIAFDPDWLQTIGCEVRVDLPRSWSGGQTGHAARQLFRSWASASATQEELSHATSRFFEAAFGSPEVTPPAWFGEAVEEIDRNPDVTTLSLANRLKLHPAWLARSFREAAGEGLQDALRRRRVETACELLAATELSLADIAAAANFCDQSHMNRCFKAVIGRTPPELRQKRRAPDVRR